MEELPKFEDALPATDHQHHRTVGDRDDGDAPSFVNAWGVPMRLNGNMPGGSSVPLYGEPNCFAPCTGAHSSGLPCSSTPHAPSSSGGAGAPLPSSSGAQPCGAAANGGVAGGGSSVPDGVFLGGAVPGMQNGDGVLSRAAAQQYGVLKGEDEVGDHLLWRQRQLGGQGRQDSWAKQQEVQEQEGAGWQQQQQQQVAVQQLAWRRRPLVQFADSVDVLQMDGGRHKEALAEGGGEEDGYERAGGLGMAGAVAAGEAGGGQIWVAAAGPSAAGLGASGAGPDQQQQQHKVQEQQQQQPLLPVPPHQQQPRRLSAAKDELELLRGKKRDWR